MSRIVKRRYKEVRKNFRAALYERVKKNKALAMLLIETYSAWHHRRHIGKIWEMFRDPQYDDFQKEYNRTLFGQHLCGREDIWKSLYFTERDLYGTYHQEIPETFAMGDALGIAYRVLRENGN
jgi:hypothetical protein